VRTSRKRGAGETKAQGERETEKDWKTEVRAGAWEEKWNGKIWEGRAWQEKG